MLVKVQAGPDLVEGFVVEVSEDDKIIVVQLARPIRDTKRYLPCGQPFRFSRRSNGRYVVVGTSRDTGSYIAEADVQGVLDAKHS